MKPDPGNPPQTLCVQYFNVSSFDGETLAEPYSRQVISPTDTGIYPVDQAGGPLGLIDPDGITPEGSMGDRFILWLELVVDAPTTASLVVVDGEDPTLVLRTIVAAQAVADVFYIAEHFRVPQGALLRIRTVGGVGGRIRLRPALLPDECCTSSSSSNDGTQQIQLLEEALINVALITDVTADAVSAEVDLLALGAPVGTTGAVLRLRASVSGTGAGAGRPVPLATDLPHASLVDGLFSGGSPIVVPSVESVAYMQQFLWLRTTAQIQLIYPTGSGANASAAIDVVGWIIG